MGYTPVTPFRRPMTAAVLEHRARAAAAPAADGVDKWAVLRRLATARGAYGLSDRDLAVMQALVSFHPETVLRPGRALIVYPSNATLCARLHGMPCSTMRRHLARLVDSGLVMRRDSPNGKRYVRRTGAAPVAYGFDLTPLAARAGEIEAHAAAAEQLAAEIAALRETVSLMHRDLFGLADLGAETHPGLGLWDRMRDAARLTCRTLRRKLDREALIRLRDDHAALIEEAGAVLAPDQSGEMSTSDGEIEQHLQRSNEESIDEDHGHEEVHETPTLRAVIPANVARDAAKLTLREVLDACPEILSYAPDGIRDWDDMLRTALSVAPMLGITLSVWEKAMLCMGRAEAAVVVAAMLERLDDIRVPGAYLHSLIRRGENGMFSCTDMIRPRHRSRAA
ncbi:plasmid replication protein RepC [Oceaniglobus roseus]|uniref:plasmid replication protein RepC n=1 Tax=Oceaniglobus roseus TaxID=1737570 RepID=UPI000C7F45C3|nr:plasmid replication protein RepC [Kandeliimicrobium roseum]